MAEVVLGVGASHTPMLSMRAEQWPELAQLFDASLPEIDFEARAEVAEAWLDEQLTPEVWAAKHAAANQCLEVLRGRLEQSDPDVVVIVGNDQREMFEEYTPMFALMDGPEVHDLPGNMEGLVGPQRDAWWAYHGDDIATYPVESDLSAHLTAELIDRDFDISVCTTETEGRSLGHAFTFVERRLMHDVSTPIVPVMLNTYYPPNQPSVLRCIELGRAIYSSIRTWDASSRIAVVASGGLSHFIVDESLDRSALDWMTRCDFDALARIERGALQSGTSETLNWICAAGILSAASLTMNVLDYIPAYRSKAKTGVGLAFATWS